MTERSRGLEIDSHGQVSRARVDFLMCQGTGLVYSGADIKLADS